MGLLHDRQVAKIVVTPGICHVDVVATAFLHMASKDKSDTVVYRAVFVMPCAVHVAVDAASEVPANTHAVCGSVAESGVRDGDHSTSSISSKQYEIEPTTVLYSAYRTAGLCYGPTFRTVHGVLFSGDHAFGVGKLSSASESWENHSYFHPAMLDGGLHPLACTRH
jgi:hypothetical protein